MPLGIKRNVRFGTIEKLEQAPFVRDVSITSVVVDYNTARFDIETNLPNTTMKYSATGVSNSDFSSGNVSHEFTTDSSGDYSITLQLDETANYSASNVEFFANVQSLADTELAVSSNITIEPSPAMVATGGTVTTTDEWTMHEFTSNANLVVSEVNDGTVYVTMVGAGGSGGRSSRFQERVFGAFNQWSLRSGGGGGAGEIKFSNTSASTYSVTTYPVVIGTGGNANINSAGSNTTFNGFIAGGGGEGGSHNVAPTAGYVNGGGGSSNGTSWYDNTTQSSTAPSNPDEYDQWYIPASGGFNDNIRFYLNGAWRDSTYNGGTAAYLFNNAGKRASNEGASGTNRDGGNAVVVNNDPTLNSYIPNNRWNAIGGGGAGNDQNGFQNITEDWVVDQVGGTASGGRDRPIWTLYPGYGTEEVAFGGFAGSTTTSGSTPSDPTTPGEGGRGGHAGRNSSDPNGTVYYDGANGADGLMRIAYITKKRAFST